MNPDLQRFVRDALSRGLPRAAIAEKLREAGWRPEEIEAGLAAFAEVDFPVPVPRRLPYLSAREAFLYLVLFATLYTTAYNAGALLFSLVDAWLPDSARRWEAARAAADAARGATAGLIIAFPVFLLLSRALGREIAREPEKRGSKVRKWLTYLTLFVAAMVLIGDLTFLVSRLLAGEIPARVLLKVAVVFVIAGTVFGHYLGELRRDDSEGAAPARELRVPPRLVAAGVVLVLIAGLVLAGSPRRERQRQMDQQRTSDLQSVTRLVREHVDQYGELPSSLAPIMAGPDIYSARFLDPVTREPYGYRVLDSLRYELCATFDATDSTGSEGGAPFWWHGPGRTCFTFDVPPRALLGVGKGVVPLSERRPGPAPRPERGP